MDLATSIDPAPANIRLFGSVARGVSDWKRDIDVLIVRPDGIEEFSEPWFSSVDAWRESVAELATNRVEILFTSETELRVRLAIDEPSVWREILVQGRHVFGAELATW
ncbi:MAG: nucleotidyltransferase domain-containing protein [Acidimicrobiia bacterium]|nr:nucleotidyltransferase domain-containing protein [Acidimicrobiia bacterium]